VPQPISGGCGTLFCTSKVRHLSADRKRMEKPMKSIPFGLSVALILLSAAVFPLCGLAEDNSSYSSNENSSKDSNENSSKDSNENSSKDSNENSSKDSNENSSKDSNENSSKDSNDSLDTSSTRSAGQTMVCVSIAQLTASESSTASGETSSKSSR